MLTLVSQRFEPCCRQIDLTPEGVPRAHEVVSALLRYLGFLARAAGIETGNTGGEGRWGGDDTGGEGPPRWVWDEMAALAAMR